MEKRGWIQNKYLIKVYLKKYLMKLKYGFLLYFFIFNSLSDIAVKKSVLKNKFDGIKK